MDRVVHLSDLIESVPEHLVKSAESGVKISKSQRLKNYFESNPYASNKDAKKALKDFGVTSADVCQARSRQARSRNLEKKNVISTSKSSKEPSIQLSELEAGVAFVKAAGSIMRAKHLLIIIEQIKAS